MALIPVSAAVNIVRYYDYSQWNADEFRFATSRLAHKTEETEAKDSGPIWQGWGNWTFL